MKSVAIDCRTFRIPINFKNCTVVQIDTKPPLFYIQGYGAFWFRPLLIGLFLQTVKYT